MNRLFRPNWNGENDDCNPTESPSLREIFESQARSVLSGSYITHFISLWRGLHDLLSKEELKHMKQQYHFMFLKNCWNWIFSVAITMLSIFLWLAFAFEDHAEELKVFKLIFPAFMFIVISIDIIIKKNPKYLQNMFFIYLLLLGITISWENLAFAKYKYHENWRVFDSIYTMISIAHCFEWK